MFFLSFSYPAPDNHSLPQRLLRFTSIDGQDPSLTLPYDPSSPVEEQVKQSFETSLKNLGVEYIDAVVLHSPLKSREVGLYFEAGFRSPFTSRPFSLQIHYLSHESLHAHIHHRTHSKLTLPSPGSSPQNKSDILEYPTVTTLCF